MVAHGPSPMLTDLDNVLLSIAQSNSAATRAILPYAAPQSPAITNEFLLLVKPECIRGNRGSKIALLLSYLETSLRRFDVSLSGIYALNWRFSVASNFLERHYFVLNRGARAISNVVPDYMFEAFSQGEVIVGAYDFLEANPHVTPARLEQLAHRHGTIKISNGTYGSLLKIGAKRHFIINAFHPEQIARMNAPGGAFLALICHSTVPFRMLTDEMVGHFNPVLAASRSLRNSLHLRKSAYGLARVDTLFNGFHISPSPLEAIFAIKRLLEALGGSFDPTETNLGRHLRWGKRPEADWWHLGHNPLVNMGNGRHFLFDLIEGRDAADIAMMLEKFPVQSVSEDEALRL